MKVVCPCITVEIEKKNILALLDSGAQVSAISEALYQQLRKGTTGIQPDNKGSFG